MPDPSPPRLTPWTAMSIAFAFLFIVYWSMNVQREPDQPRYDVSYTQFRTLVENDAVKSITLRGTRIEGELSQPRAIGPNGKPGTLFSSRLPDFGGDSTLALLDKHDVSVSVKPPAEENLLLRLVVSLLPWLFLAAFFVWYYRRTTGMLGGGGPGGMGDFLGKSTKPEAHIPDVTFDDVAGHAGAKADVQELVALLKNPENYRRVGAEIPHGVLLMGPPGTGKTLMAKALAGEAGVPFFSTSGSEFIEVFVGVGASRVRKLFAAAKAQAPSIVFIDELDSVGRTRGTGLGGGHDEREQTLNQILAEMDGFAVHEAVLVLAATNRPDVLDPALLRPGRFDRHVTLDLPDMKDRQAILAVHTRRTPLASDASLETVAAGTPGFSGADLHNLVNEAAMLAARDGRDHVSLHDFDESREKIMLGAARTLAIQPGERHRLAVHESGHTAVAHFLPETDPLYKVTIIPRGRALGGTHQLPTSERHTLPEDYLKDRLAVMMGGRAAEHLVIGTVSSGADDDIHQATALARAMVARWGMAEEVGPVDLRQSEEQPFLGREMAQPRHFSERSAERVDDAVRALLCEADERATQIISANRDGFDRLVAALEERETLDRPGIEECLGAAAQAANVHPWPERGERPNTTRTR